MRLAGVVWRLIGDMKRVLSGSDHRSSCAFGSSSRKGYRSIQYEEVRPFAIVALRSVDGSSVSHRVSGIEWIVYANIKESGHDGGKDNSSRTSH
jgi:hypothetical protein